MHLPKVKIYQLFTLRNELEGGPVVGILGPTLCRVLIPPPPPPPPKQAHSLNPHSAALTKPCSVVFLVL